MLSLVTIAFLPFAFFHPVLAQDSRGFALSCVVPTA